MKIYRCTIKVENDGTINHIESDWHIVAETKTNYAVGIEDYFMNIAKTPNANALYAIDNAHVMSAYDGGMYATLWSQTTKGDDARQECLRALYDHAQRPCGQEIVNALRKELGDEQTAQDHVE